ncbi:MAG: adenylate/guanylate cyclase domain-containing protein [Microthrixaceae bacterium]
MANPTTRYARSGDVHIAYQVVGDGPVDLVVAPGFVSHCDLNWTMPAYVDFVGRLATFARVILFDKRGTGLSDVTPDLGSFDTRMDDIEAVMDAAGSERASLFGYSEGGPLAALYAATHPDRVATLTLFGSFPGGGYIPDDMRRRLDDALDHWGEGRTAGIFLADADSPMVRRFMGLYERAGASPAAARMVSEIVRTCDVTPVLPALHVPTLVVHRREDPFALALWGLAMAEAIPEALYVEIEGDDHLPWMGDPSELIAAVEDHLAVEDRHQSSSRLLGTVLFTDLVGSTSTLTKVGDERWARTMQQHNDFCRSIFDQLDAWAIKSTGDGFMACFSTPEKAVQAAMRVLAGMPDLGLSARAGLHTGELERVDIDDIVGITPTIASRIADLAGPDQLLASQLTVDLLVGYDHGLEPRGSHDLKGVPDPVEIFQVGERPDSTEPEELSATTTGSDRVTLGLAQRVPTLMRALMKLGDR